MSRDRFDTQLSGADEAAFQKWKAKFAPNDTGVDYDLRGAFKAGLRPDPKSGHWPDTFKKPNHPTFSDQSRYAKDAPERAGHWNGDTYVPHAAEPDSATVVQLPDGRELHFEPGTPMAVVRRVYGQYLAQGGGSAADSAAQEQGREMNRGPAMTRRFERAIPYVGGMVGGMAGGVPGATMGGMMGKVAEQGLAGEMPASLKEGLDTIGGAGAEQGLLETIAQIPGMAAHGAGPNIFRGGPKNVLEAGVSGLKGVNEYLSGKATRNAAARASTVGEVDRAMAPKVRQAAEQAVAARGAAGKAATEAVRGAPESEPTTFGEIVDRMVDNRSQALGGLPVKNRKAIENTARTVLRRVLGESGFFTGRETTFNTQETHIVKRILQGATTWGESKLGKLALDDVKEVSSAFRQSAEARVPGLGDLNAATQSRMPAANALTRMAKRPSMIPEVADLTNQRRIMLAERLANMPGDESAIGVSAGLHGLSPRLGNGRQLLQALEAGAQDPLTRLLFGTGANAARMMALLHDQPEGQP